MGKHIDDLQEMITIHDEIVEDLENKVNKNEVVTELVLNPLFKSWEDIKNSLKRYGISTY